MWLCNCYTHGDDRCWIQSNWCAHLWTDHDRYKSWWHNWHNVEFGRCQKFLWTLWVHGVGGPINWSIRPSSDSLYIWLQFKLLRLHSDVRLSRPWNFPRVANADWHFTQRFPLGHASKCLVWAKRAILRDSIRKSQQDNHRTWLLHR